MRTWGTWLGRVGEERNRAELLGDSDADDVPIPGGGRPSSSAAPGRSRGSARRSPLLGRERRVGRVALASARRMPAVRRGGPMPQAVIVATGRTPIGRANKGSLVDCRPDDLTAHVVEGGPGQGALARPGAGRGPDRRLRPAGRRVGLQHRPGGRDPGRPARRARRDRQPLLLLVAADHPHGRPRHPRRRGRRVHRGGRGDRQPLPATARPTPAPTTRSSPTPRRARPPGRRP